MAIERGNPFLSEVIEDLDLKLQKYGGDQAKALDYLSKEDSQWIDDEVIHCMVDTRYFLSNYYAGGGGESPAAGGAFGQGPGNRNVQLSAKIVF